MPDEVGLWGGTCTCPDGHIYQVGDNLDYCGSLACFGGVSGACGENNAEGSHYRVFCAVPPPPPQPPGAPPSPPPPPHRTDTSAAIINARFRRSPYTALWRADGFLADAGLLVHVFDGWEAGGEQYLPGTNGPGRWDMSASMIFAEQQRAAGSLRAVLFNGGYFGIIFRPGVTKIKCGKPQDSGGSCGDYHCPWRSHTNIDWNEGDDKFCNWTPETFGVELQRLTAWQAAYHRPAYNEIIIDAEHWRAHMPDVIEAIYGDRRVLEQFVRAYPGVSEQTHPFLTLDAANWDEPFQD